MSQLPESWELASLQAVVPYPEQDIVDGPFGSNLKASEYRDTGVPIIRLQNVSRNRFLEKNIRFISKEKASELSRHNFVAGDIAITKLGDPLGKATIIPPTLPDGVIVADIVRVRVDSRFAEARYLSYGINSPDVCSALAEHTKGTTRPRVNLGHIRALKIPFAPRKEQTRIADKLDTILGRVNICREHLDRVPIILKRFRQAVLAAAASGKLTDDWELGVHNSYLAVRQEWRTLKVRDLVTNEGLFADGDWIESKDQDPKGNIRLIQLADIGDGEFVDKSKRYINEDAFARINCTELAPGDILVARMPDPLGRACIFPNLSRRCITAVDVAILRPINADINNKWLVYAINAPKVRAQMQLLASGTTRQRVTRRNLGDIELAVPSIHEQNEIVRRAEILFSYADRVESRYSSARDQVEKLSPSLLAKAFCGNLVPQDPNDEPASELLQRIGMAYTAAQQSKKALRSKRKEKAEVFVINPASIPNDYLAKILKRKGRLSSKALWQASELKIEDFYEQLRLEEKQGRLRETKKKTESYLEAA